MKIELYDHSLQALENARSTFEELSGGSALVGVVSVPTLRSLEFRFQTAQHFNQTRFGGLTALQYSGMFYLAASDVLDNEIHVFGWPAGIDPSSTSGVLRLA